MTRFFSMIAFWGFASLSFAQICDKNPLFKQGTKVAYTHYSAPDKIESKTRQTVKSIENTEGGKWASIQTELFNKKDKLQQTLEYKVGCKGNVFTMDYKNMVPKQTLEAYKNMEMTMTGSNIEYPEKLVEKQKLADGKVNLSVSNSGMKMMDMTLEIVNRTVEKSEKVTTPAGTFDCMVINSETKMVTTTMGMPIKANLKTKEWFSPNIGIVKTETFRENGKPEGFMLLTELTLP